MKPTLLVIFHSLSQVAFVWKKGSKPWEWTQVSVDQPEIEIMEGLR